MHIDFALAPLHWRNRLRVPRPSEAKCHDCTRANRGLSRESASSGVLGVWQVAGVYGGMLEAVADRAGGVRAGDCDRGLGGDVVGDEVQTLGGRAVDHAARTG